MNLKLTRYHIPVLDKKRKFLFLATRKASTHSIVRHLLKDRAVEKKKNLRLHRQLMKTYDFDKVFKFTIVRNPWSRCVSAFHALQQYSRKFLDMTFQEFVINKLDGSIETFPDWHFIPQAINFYYEGEWIVDDLVYLETINEEWPRIAAKIGCSDKLPHKNKSKHKHYSEYYDDKTKEIVRNVYQRDISLLGYKF